MTQPFELTSRMSGPRQIRTGVTPSRTDVVPDPQTSRWFPVTTPFSGTSMTTVNIAAFFLLSLFLFIFSVTFNFPQILHPNAGETLIDGRISRNNRDYVTSAPNESSYHDTISENFRDYAFVFNTPSYTAGIDPYKDCRYKQCSLFARKRQIVLPKRNQFLIKPNISKFADKFRSPQFCYLLIITYPTSFENRTKLRNWAAYLTKVNVLWTIKLSFVLFSPVENLPLDVKNESHYFNDLIVSSFSDYKMIRSLAWISNVDSELLNYFQYFIFIGAANKGVSKSLLATLQNLYSQNSHILGQSEASLPSLFGGLNCYDYQSVSSDWKSFPSLTCSLDAFYCSSDLVVMTSSIAGSVSDISWNIPLIDEEPRFVGLALEYSGLKYTTIVLQKYIVGEFGRKENAKKVNWLIDI
ncbi:uncharacterized protein LOC142344837 isoform X1 [Convolutriloba macropyga]|uniref:uncharacterized protein LOC142344837 isoform X1 n=1 Tax=Convolutriloba macropyga TaxID=536237 RepID=UPI003F521591